MSHKVVFNNALLKACVEKITSLVDHGEVDSVTVDLPFVPTEEELADLLGALNSEYFDCIGQVWQSVHDRKLLHIYLN